MRAVIISSLYGLHGGGAGLTAYYLAHGLKEVGWHVAVITIGGCQIYSSADEGGVDVYRFQPRNLYAFDEKDNHPRWQKTLWQIGDIYNFDSARVMRRILQKESPDVVHLHKMRGFSGSVWPVSARQCPGRTIQTCHDYESISPDGLLRGSIGRMAIERKWPIRAYQLIRARLSAGISRVTAPSTFTLKRITNSGIFPNAPAKVVPNSHGWSTDKLQLLQKNHSSPINDRFHFLFLGRLEHEKGVMNLCEAFLQAYRINPYIKLDIAGWGSLNLELRQRFARHPGIQFLGAVEGRAKEATLRNATVVVIPSLVEEVFGLVTVEAFAFGKPVIASRVGGLPELVRSYETGWLVPPGDADALAEQLKDSAKMNAGAIEKMSQNCKEYSYQFAVERVMREYLDIYGQLIK